MKQYVSWDEIEHFVNAICQKYRGKVSSVYGLPRGGLVFAVMISHRLDIPMVTAPARNCLIVDDICDSGESLLHYFKNSSRITTEARPLIATMYYKPNNLRVHPDFYMYEKEDNWIVFPWELKQEDKYE